MDRKSILYALLDACRHVAAERLEEAASGVGSKGHAFVAVVALEAAHAWLSLNPETVPLPPEPARVDPLEGERMVELQLSTPMPDVVFTFRPPRSEHGSN